MSAYYVKHFEETERYEQPGGVFYEIMRRGGLADVSMGWVRMKGPDKSVVGRHEKWDQAYLVLGGSGLLHLGSERFHLTDHTIAVIPRGVEHWVELREGETLDYIYVNRYTDRLGSE